MIKNQNAVQILFKHAPEYFADLVRRNLMKQDKGEELLRELLAEITSENASEAGTEGKVDEYNELINKKI